MAHNIRKMQSQNLSRRTRSFTASSSLRIYASIFSIHDLAMRQSRAFFIYKQTPHIQWHQISSFLSGVLLNPLYLYINNALNFFYLYVVYRCPHRASYHTWKRSLLRNQTRLGLRFLCPTFFDFCDNRFRFFGP